MVLHQNYATEISKNNPTNKAPLTSQFAPTLRKPNQYKYFLEIKCGKPSLDNTTSFIFDLSQNLPSINTLEVFTVLYRHDFAAAILKALDIETPNQMLASDLKH